MVRLDLLQKVFNKFKDETLNWRPHRINKLYINWLFKHYDIIEYCYNWYDSGPDIPEKWQEYFGSNLWKNKEFLYEYNKLLKAYEEQRLNKLFWQDPYGEGIWGQSQETVNKNGKERMLDCRKLSISKKNRFWIAESLDRNIIWLYWYGRDLKHQYDLCWIMKRKI